MGEKIQLSLISRLMRTKPLDTVKEEKLARVLTTLDLTALGVGSTLGVGIYILAGAISKTVAGPSVVAGFLIAAVASTFSGLCFAEVAVVIPTDGAAYSYAYVAIGELAGFAAGWILILQYFMAAATVSKGFSGYTDYLIGNKIRNTLREQLPIDVPILGPYPDFFAIGIIMLASVILFLGVRDTSRFNKAFTVMNLSVVTYVIVCGAFKANLNNWQIEKEDIPEESREAAGEGGFFPFGFSGLMAGAAECLVGFVGFEVIATTGEEAINPRRSIPISMIVSLFFVTLGYSGISAVLTLMWPYYLQDTYAPIPHVFHEIGWDVAMWIVNVGAFFGISTGLLGTLFPIPRVIYSMADDGLLFRKLAYVSPKTQTPVYATIVACLLASSMGALLDLDELVAIVSLATFPAFIFVATSLLVLRYREEKTQENEGSRQTNRHYSCCDIFLRMLNLKKLQRPNRLSTKVSGWAVFIFCILTICLCAAGIFTEPDLLDGELYAVILVGSLGCTVLLSLIIIGIQPQSQRNDFFKVPLVPFIPAFTIILNIFLMMKLPWETWVKFGIWLVLGFIIYFAYGISESSEEYRLRGRRIPGDRTGSIASSNRSIYRHRNKSRSTLSIQSSQLNVHANEDFAHDEEAGLKDSTKQTGRYVTHLCRSISELSSGSRSIPESPAVEQNEIMFYSQFNGINDSVVADQQEAEKQQNHSIARQKQPENKAVSEKSAELDIVDLQEKADEEKPTTNTTAAIVDSLQCLSYASVSITDETAAELVLAMEAEDITEEESSSLDTAKSAPENIIRQPGTKEPRYTLSMKPKEPFSADDRLGIRSTEPTPKVITQKESTKSPPGETIDDRKSAEYLLAKKEGEGSLRSTKQFLPEIDNLAESKEPLAISRKQSSVEEEQLQEPADSVEPSQRSAESIEPLQESTESVDPSQESTEQLPINEESQKQAAELTKPSAESSEQCPNMEEKPKVSTKPSVASIDILKSEGIHFKKSPVRANKIDQIWTDRPHLSHINPDSPIPNTENSHDKAVEPNIKATEETSNTEPTDSSQPSLPADSSKSAEPSSPSFTSSTENSSPSPKSPFLYELPPSVSFPPEELTETSVFVKTETSFPSSIPEPSSPAESSTAALYSHPAAEFSSPYSTSTVESSSVFEAQPTEFSIPATVSSPLISGPGQHDPSKSLSHESCHPQSEASASATNVAISEPSTVQQLAKIYGGTKRDSGPIVNGKTKGNADKKGGSQTPIIFLPLECSLMPIKRTEYIKSGGEAGDVKSAASSLIQSSPDETLPSGDPLLLVESSSIPDECSTTSAPITVRQLSQLYGESKRIVTPRGGNPRPTACSEDENKSAAIVVNEHSEVTPKSVKDLSRLFGGSRK